MDRVQELQFEIAQRIAGHTSPSSRRYGGGITRLVLERTFSASEPEISHSDEDIAVRSLLAQLSRRVSTFQAEKK